MKKPSKPLTEPKSLEEHVGDAVRDYRADQNITLADFSKISGVSKAMISKIERGQVSASLSTLNALAKGMGVPIANLFASTIERKEVSFVKANAGIETRRSGSTYGHTYQQIGRASDDGKKVECYLITINKSAAGQPMLLMPGIEFVHILIGAMIYRIGEDTYNLAEGDSLTFNGEMPHGPKSVSTEFVKFLTVTVI